VSLPEPSQPTQRLLVAVVTAGFALWALSLVPLSEPLGTDVQRYLGNAVALGTGELGGYHTWRAPLHAWAILGLAPWVGGLVPASQILALAAITGLLPLTWWLGRRLWGPWTGLLAVGLLAAWPDLGLFARASTPYPLNALLLTAGLAAGVAALERPRVWAPACGLALGLCVGGDVRGGALAVAVLAAVAVLGQSPLRTAGVVLAAGLLAAGVGLGVRATLPLPLTPLSEQIQFQRELHAQGGPPTCRGVPAPLGPAAVFTPCARDTLRSNLARGRAASPVPMAVWAGLVAVGVVTRRRRGAPLLLPVLGALPTAMLVGFEGRYLLPLATPLALLGAAGLAACTQRPPRWGGAGAVAVVVGLGLAWHHHPGTALAHASTPGGPGSAPGAGRLLIRSPLALVADRLSAGEPGDRLVDCTRSGLRTWVYPRPVETWRPARGHRLDKRCGQVLAATPVRTTWVLLRLRPGSQAPQPWDEVLRDPLADAGGQLVLLHGEPAAR